MGGNLHLMLAASVEPFLAEEPLKMQEHEQQMIDSQVFPQEVARWFATPLQQTSIIYTPQPTTLGQQQDERKVQIPVMDRSHLPSRETTDVALVSYIMQPQLSPDEQRVSEIHNFSIENLSPCLRPNPSDCLSLVVMEPKIKDVATNTGEKWEVKRLAKKKPASKADITDLKPKMESTTAEQRPHQQPCIKYSQSFPDLMNHKCNQKQGEGLNCNQSCVTPVESLGFNFLEKMSEPLVCQVCNIYFSNHEIFLKHQESHGIGRNYNCTSNSSQEFFDVEKPKKYEMMNETQFVCNICNKSFYCNAMLMAHKRVHSDDRPYECDVCSKRFFTKSHVQNHRRVHSGERPFSCSVCGRAFAESSSHRRHERLHQQNKKYQCDICGRGFALAVSLSKHLAKLHSYT